MNKYHGGLNDRQQPICVRSSISRASVWQWEWVGRAGWALLPNPEASHRSSAAFNAGFLLPSRRWSWYFTMMAFGFLVCQEAAQGRAESCNTGQTASSQFLAKQKHICQTKRSRQRKPHCRTHFSAENEMIELKSCTKTTYTKTK